MLLLATGPAAFARSAPDSFADLAEKLLPAVVNIATTTKITDANRGDPNLEELFKQFFDRQNRGQGRRDQDGDQNGDNGDRDRAERRQRRRSDGPPHEVTSLGSGFIIDPTGYIVTNNHVIEGAEEITVRMQDNTEYKARLIGHDPKTDLALLKIDAPTPLPFVEWGDSDKARIGDWVLAIGNPFGLGGTVTAGIVSARQRDINAGPYDDFIQTDAAINRGNSGGPMFDMDGKVIGINTAIFSPSGGSIGIGFALPSSLAKGVIAQLRQYGHPRRGWLGRAHPERDAGTGRRAEDGQAHGRPHRRRHRRRSGGQGRHQARATWSSTSTARRSTRCAICRASSPRRPSTPPCRSMVLRQGKEMTFQVKLGELDETAETKAGREPTPSRASPRRRMPRRPSWAFAWRR